MSVTRATLAKELSAVSQLAKERKWLTERAKTALIAGAMSGFILTMLTTMWSTLGGIGIEKAIVVEVSIFAPITGIALLCAAVFAAMLWRFDHHALDEKQEKLLVVAESGSVEAARARLGKIKGKAAQVDATDCSLTEFAQRMGEGSVAAARVERLHKGKRRACYFFLAVIAVAIILTGVSAGLKHPELIKAIWIGAAALGGIALLAVVNRIMQLHITNSAKGMITNSTQRMIQREESLQAKLEKYVGKVGEAIANSQAQSNLTRGEEE